MPEIVSVLIFIAFSLIIYAYQMWYEGKEVWNLNKKGNKTIRSGATPE